MIIKPIRTEIPAVVQTDVFALMDSLRTMTATDAITAILAWKEQTTSEYLNFITGISVADIESAANTLATQTTPTVTVS